MNLRQCEIFRAVMTASSITEAADRLGITQPAVSKMLAQIERDLGFPLFLRERRRLVPTPEAQALFKEVERAFLGLEHLTRFARDLKGLRQGHLVLGAPYAAAAGWLPGVVAGFLRQHPGLSLSLRTMNSLSVAQSLAAGHLDLGLVQFEVLAPGVRRECLLPVEAVCVLPPGHRLASRPVLGPVDLRDEPLVALAAADRYRQRLEAELAARDIVPRIRVDAPLASAACALVMEGMGIALVDRLTAEDNRHRGILIRPFAPRLAEDLTLLTPTRRPVSLAVERFAGFLREHFRCAAAPALA
ncbi:MAG: LysR family transcriptional regulator [Azospirillum brasilense]|nr:MAG: LysR family transcriptional regulator [Azospirillum brasilense]